MLALIEKQGAFSLEKIPDPKPCLEEVLVAVEAIGINHADLLQRQGKYPPPTGASPILGLEVAGTIIEIGPHAKHFKLGDRVMCLLTGGGYAEKAAVHQARCMPIPKDLSFEMAAAIPETFLTAYQALFTIGELQPAQWVLIHAGGSGVGTAALQLARATDAKTIATTRSQEKLEKCLALADAVINPTQAGFAKKVLELTEGHGVDLILDFAGAPYFVENMEAIARGGAMISLATLGGTTLENFDLSLLIKKWVTLCGTSLRNRPIEYVAQLTKEFSHFALPYFKEGRLKPIIHAAFPWHEVEQAHEILLHNQAFGKLVLIVV